MLRNTEQRYGSVSKLLHWVIALLVLCMLIVGYFMGDIKNDALQAQVINLHKLTGLTILALIVIRLIWTLLNPKPVLPLGTPAWQIFAERLVQSLFYVFLLLMPLSGWVMSVAAGYAPKLNGIMLNLPINKNKPLSNTAFDVHATIAIILITLICIHVLAALYHYFVKKDDILNRMI